MLQDIRERNSRNRGRSPVPDGRIDTVCFIRIFNHMVKYHSDSLDAVFRALSDPTRRAILSKLSGDEAPVNELASSFDISLPAVSKHLNVLEKAGLIRREKDGRLRRCRLDAAPLGEAAAWLQSYKVFWETRLGALDQYLEAQSAGDEP